ncbi:MAG: hypothetical protein Q8O68_00635 [Candidatus Daviesbacteria bacterium]|nr:hypothetical protein [Candidatus Daviesbacteria bacterium]
MTYYPKETLRTVTDSDNTTDNNIIFLDDTSLIFGTGSDVSLLWETADADSHYLNLVLSGSNNFIISSTAGIDWSHAASTNPTLWLQSADSGEPTEYIQLYHDQTDGFIKTGKGVLSLSGATEIVAIPGETGTGSPQLLLRSATATVASFRLGELSTTTVYLEAMHDFDQLVLLTANAVGNQIIIGNSAASSQDFDHVIQTHPTLFIHSDTNPDSDNTQWTSIHNDLVGGRIATGMGDLIIDPFSQHVGINQGALYPLHVLQPGTIAAIPVLGLTQRDSDHGFIDLEGSVSVGLGSSITTDPSGFTSVAGPVAGPSIGTWEIRGMAKQNVRGLPFWMPYYGTI